MKSSWFKSKDKTCPGGVGCIFFFYCLVFKTLHFSKLWQGIVIPIVFHTCHCVELRFIIGIVLWMPLDWLVIAWPVGPLGANLIHQRAKLSIVKGHKYWIFFPRKKGIIKMFELEITKKKVRKVWTQVSVQTIKNMWLPFDCERA